MRLSAAARGCAVAGVMAAATARARSLEVGSIEGALFRRCNNAPDAVHPPLWGVMQFGSLGAVFVTAAAVYERPRPTRAALVLIVGTSVWGGVKLVKPLVGRGRPQQHLQDVKVRGEPQTGLGFPSGHAAVATALALVATKPGTPARRVALAAALVTGGARMYVGAHLPLDVAGGLALGAAAGLVANGLKPAR